MLLLCSTWSYCLCEGNGWIQGKMIKWDLILDGGVIKKVDGFKYLGSMMAILENDVCGRIERSCLVCTLNRGVTGKFFLGGKVTLPDFFLGVKCFFPVENFHFGRPKTNFSGFEKWGEKVLSSFRNFSLLPFSIFHIPFYNFPSFLLHFSFFFFHFFLASFSPVDQQKFPGRKSRGEHLPPACYATDFATLIEFVSRGSFLSA